MDRKLDWLVSCLLFFLEYLKLNIGNRFTKFGATVPYRPVEDLAFIVAKFLLKVQYHGGMKFGRTAGGPFIGTTYDYDAPIDEYGWLSKLAEEDGANARSIHLEVIQ
ncbi:hypothetical protein GIB67_024424 [Kingdonia uniflora]|uniref:beta-galactosidase n=1 Tax=Kingdonia uniflora TaxID=39325 RepID=A0A7J7P554_9MAGN|nr:hypothetical protein GIB67_024424 [Kingdonia uniflora]